jgi:two-component system response regulator HydG
LRAEVNLDYSMVGVSGRMKEVFEFIRRVAPTDATVLIEGESGTGKELVARAIHRNSRRNENAFVAINCAAIAENLLESELFGHEKGAFTGAVAQKKGKIEIAEGGTLFLDEVGELAPELQAKLLRVLQEKEFERVGATRPISLDVRLIAATNKKLSQAVDHGEFRKDLYYRLNVVTVAMPALRDRPEDIPQLAEFFLAKVSRKCKTKMKSLSEDAKTCLLRYDWPGNVRELENVIERAIVTSHSDSLEESDFTWLNNRAGGETTWEVPDVSLNELERRAIIAVLERKKGNVKEAAASLGIDRSTLYDKLKRYEITH